MSDDICGVTRVVRGISVIDGAGVRLHRIIGSPRLSQIDPFVLLDEFKSDNPKDYLAGFPDHPHRGIETITYMIEGKFRHRDSRGGGGVLTPGCVQWMTAGKGIIHSEMPEMESGQLWGYQLWLNLAAKDKMIEPRYQHLDPKDIPTVEKKGLQVKLISGSFDGQSGPALTQFPVNYFDFRMAGNGSFQVNPQAEEICFIYVHTGSVRSGEGEKRTAISSGQLALFDAGDRVLVQGDGSEAGFLFFSGPPHNEPIVRGGPFVMNTQEEIEQAFSDYQNGDLF